MGEDITVADGKAISKVAEAVIQAAKGLLLIEVSYMLEVMLAR